jgi:hypothetical protein
LAFKSVYTDLPMASSSLYALVTFPCVASSLSLLYTPLERGFHHLYELEDGWFVRQVIVGIKAFITFVSLKRQIWTCQ